ncbi:DUF5331 domain-containing protein [Limnospira fusiformis]|uniref:DUF5331 domain-containing protein n=1 Tax=Limnospira fusiformis TaxID=54297 RepID=UPI0034E061E5
MAFFQEFTTALKQKWLDYYQANREWLVLQMDISSIPTPDGGRRPSSALILGTINALDPEAALLMFPFSKLNPDPEKLIEVLGLHFDPDHELAGISGSSPDQPPVPQEPVKAAPGYHPPQSIILEPEQEEELVSDDLDDAKGELDLLDGAGDDLATDGLDLDDTGDDLATDDMDLGLGDDATDDLATDDMDLGLGDAGDDLATDG